MAKKHREPPAPVGVADPMPRYQKRYSMGPEASDQSMSARMSTLMDDYNCRTSGPELTPARESSNRKWDSGSYDEFGRPVNKRIPAGGDGEVSAGRHTTGSPGRSMRPGRW